MTQEPAFPIFVVVSTLLSIALGVFYSKADPETKRQYHPWLLMGTGVLFIVFIYAMNLMVLAAIPAVFVLMLFAYKVIHFCPACGKTIQQNPPWVRMEHCPKCGANLGRDSPVS